MYSHYFYNKFFILIFFSFLFFGCHTHQSVLQVKDDGANEKLPLSYGEQRKLDIAFTDGLIQKMQGNYPQAMDKFNKCLDIYPYHAASMYEIAYISNEVGKSNDAIPFIQKAVSIDDNNTWYKLLLAHCLMETSRFSDASDVFQKIIKYDPDKIEHYFNLASALLHAGRMKDALEVYDKIEEKMGVTEELCIQKQRIFLTQNQFGKAVGEVQKLIQAFPGNTKYYRMLAALYLQNNMQEKAHDIFNKIFKIDPNDPYTHLMLANYYESMHQDSMAFFHLKIAFKNPDLDIDEKMKIIIKYFDVPEKFKQKRNESDTLIALMLRIHPNDPKSYSIHGDFLNRDGKSTEARESFRKAINLDKSRFPLWQQLMVLDEILNDFVSMESDSRQAIELFPAEASSYLFNASALYQKKNYKDAIETLNIGKDYVAGEKKLLAQFYSLLGDCYNGTKENNLSDENYEKALNLDTENANIMNNWSYYLSLRGEHLDKAEKMSRKANQIVKENASYEDTYAWVLYKMKQYDEALRWLTKAIEHGGEKNGIMLEHIGDVYFHLNQQNNAIEYWQKAKVAGKYSDLLDKKLTDKKMYE
ncbi:MAG: tetratricopeptide repeat protein [Bacteroidota bacterium]